MPEYDVIIAGLGAMGSAAAWHLSASGYRVLGLERFEPPHQFGSSHGLTRIIREAYFEHPLYVPLVQRAYELWSDLEGRSGRKLLVQTGGLMIGPAGGVLVTGAIRSAKAHKLPHQLLSAEEIRKRFPAFALPDKMVAVWEPRAGILFPELAIQSYLEIAREKGAALKFNTPVIGWKAHEGGVRVDTGVQSYTASNLVLSAGSWMNSLLPDLRLPLSVERQVLFWFEPLSRQELFKSDRFPIFIWEFAYRHFFYGFPDLGDGVKIGIHHEGQTAQPDSINREVSEAEIETARNLLCRFFPSAAGKCRSAAVCMYTNTPDEHFLLDRHPLYPQVLIVSPCSGHGFKFSAVIGEITATLLSGGKPVFDLNLFRLSRFANLAVGS